MNVLCISLYGFLTQLGIGILSSAIVLGLGYLIAYEQHLKKKFQKYIEVELEYKRKLNEIELKNRELEEHGFMKSWANQKEAESELLKDMKASRKICIFTTRGGTFSNTDNNEIAEYLFLNRQYLDTRILLSHQDNPFLVERQKELERARKTKVNDLRIEAKTSFDRLLGQFGEDCVKQHKENPVRYRLILLEECMYISQHLTDRCSQESLIVKYNKASFWYPILSAEFDGLWQKTVEG